jgi:hypothetical protein
MDNQHEREQMSTPEEEQVPAADDQRDDTAGYAMGSPAAILWTIAPQVALKLTLPDPPPDERIPNLPRNPGLA